MTRSTPRHASRRRARPRAGHRRVPAFAPVPLRPRADGWSPQRQAAFLGALAETGSVSAAAARVGMCRETAYRLRRRPGAGGFAAAWDAAAGRAAPRRRKVTAEELAARALGGLLKPLLWRGRYCGCVRKPDNSALLRLVAQLGRARGDRGPPARAPALMRGTSPPGSRQPPPARGRPAERARAPTPRPS